MFDPDANHHQLLEGVLLRLAAHPNTGAFILRGGLLMRHWFRPVPRVADDIDLIATFPFDVKETERRLQPILEAAADDGVTFDAERTRVSGIRLETDVPGVRVFATGTAGGEEIDFNVDVTFGPPPRPPAVLTDLPTASGLVARVWACRPEAVVGQKVQALCYRGALAWRPKDLDDLRLLLARVPLNATDLRAVIPAYVADIGLTTTDARVQFGPESWWELKMSAARWQDFVRETRVRSVPSNLVAVVADVAARLAPIWEDAS